VLSFAGPGQQTFGSRAVTPYLTVPSYNRLAPLWAATEIGWSVLIAASIASLVVRYWRGGDLQRRQLLWLVLAVMIWNGAKVLGSAWEDVRQVDALGLEVGYRLIPLVDKNQDGELLRRIKGLRKKFAQEIGFLTPPVHIRDDLELKPNGYRITLKGVESGLAEAHPGDTVEVAPGEYRERVVLRSGVSLVSRTPRGALLLPPLPGAAGSPEGGAGNDSTLVGSSRPRQRALSAAMTASAFVTTETFCSAKLIEALCQSAFIVEQQSSGTIMK